MKQVFLLPFLIAAPSFAGQVRDTTPPVGRLTSPRSGMVIANNTVPLSAQASDAHSGIKEVRFFGSYRETVDSVRSIGGYELLGTVTDTPYTYYWDCSRIPDQDQWNLHFYCEIEDRAGNTISPPSKEERVALRQDSLGASYVVLDRNEYLSPLSVTSGRTNRTVTIDGTPTEKAWNHATDSLRFVNADNTVSARSVWNRSTLYFAVSVADSRITMLEPQDTAGFDTTQLHLYLADGVELFFDGLHDHTSMTDSDDRHLLIGADGAFYGHIVDIARSVDTLWQCAIQCSATTTAEGYVLEIAIPWECLGIEPADGGTIGFDLFNTDRDGPAGIRIGRSWAGNERLNNNNPSEWANLKLAEPPKAQWNLVLVFAVAIVGVGGLLAMRRRKTPAGHPGASATAPFPQKPLSSLVASACDCVHARFREETLSLTSVADTLNLSPKYLSRVFNKEMGVSFREYLNRYRIGWAEKLLVSTDKGISEIAFEVGYRNPGHFNVVFKKMHRVTPKEFRRRSSSAS